MILALKYVLLKQIFFDLSFLQPVNKPSGAQDDEESDDSDGSKTPTAVIVQQPIDKEKTKSHRSEG